MVQNLNQLIFQSKLDTLGQSATTSTLKKSTKATVTVYGKGTDISKAEVFERRTKKKVMTQSIALALIDVCKTKEKSQKLENSFWNTYYCQNKITSVYGRIYGNYCKNMLCPVCNGIRKAELINKYLPIGKNWPDAYFVTITAKAVPAKV